MAISNKVRIGASLAIFAALIYWTWPEVPQLLGVLLLLWLALWLISRVISVFDRLRGWRITCDDDYKDTALRYGEWHQGKWREFWIGFPARSMFGRAEIYPRRIEYPEWTHGRETEILERIRSKYSASRNLYAVRECPPDCTIQFLHHHENDPPRLNAP